MLPATATGDVTRVILEDTDFRVSLDTQVEEWAKLLSEFLPAKIGNHYGQKFLRDLAVVQDEEFEHLCRHGTQISARIALNEKKTTTGGKGNLWYEETITPETLFYSIVMAEKPRVPCAIASSGGVMDYLRDTVLRDGILQIGGNETVGQGWCLVNLAKGGAGVGEA